MPHLLTFPSTISKSLLLQLWKGNLGGKKGKKIKREEEEKD